MTRVALVTGAAGGMGGRLVVELARRGWHVVALDRCSDDERLPCRLPGPEALEAIVAEAEAEAAATGHGAGGVPVLSLQGDASDLDTMRSAVGLAEERFGGLDAVVAAAGVIAGGVPAWQVPVAEEAAVLEVDLHAVLVAARAGVPALLRRPQPRQGRFVAIASAAATRGLPMLAAYCAAKAGVTGFVRALAVELAGEAITANAVSPGSTETAILEESARIYGLESAEAFAVQQPIRRLIQPGEVAQTVCFLLSGEAAAITGANVAVDGGLAL